MAPRRLKTVILSAGLAVSALTLVAWTQPWFGITLSPDELAGAEVTIGGEVAGGSLAALGLAGLALVGALSIAGPVFRAVLGVLEMLIGATVSLTSVVALASPVLASAAAISEATGESGRDSLGDLVESTAPTPWPVIALLLGLATVVVGVVIVVTGRRWPGSARKYQAARFEDGDPVQEAPADAEPDAIADWDALSDGSDPTSR